MLKSPVLWFVMVVGLIGGGLSAQANFNEWAVDIIGFFQGGIERVNEGNSQYIYNPDAGRFEQPTPNGR